MDGKLLCKVIQGIERVARVEVFLILAVAALDLSVVARCVRTDQFMPDMPPRRKLFWNSRHSVIT